ncbi:MAG TPA: DUF229 domain-containing protein [Deltaproteobacteria bacterium]|nr:DUF229 domain-containing protein [Deltaproteobacteria bacterium]
MRTGTKLAAILGSLVLISVATATVLRSGERAPPAHPNVLFVVWDTVRADRLSIYGHDKPTTPFLEEIAPRSAVWDNAISPSFWTLPSHASLFTGLSVSAHGTHADYKWLDGRFLTLAEHFSGQGYATYAWSSNPNINRNSNTIQGFDTFHQAFGQNRWRAAVEAFTKGLIHPEDETTRPNPDRHQVISYHKSGPVIHDAFTGWLDERPPDAPFFAFLNYMEAHTYRLPTEEARRAIMTDPASYHRALKTSNQLRRQTNVMFGRWRRYFRHERQALFDLYDASIVDLDRYLRGLFQALEDRDLLDDTIVVLTADHGEQFGEHGLYLHNYSLYQPLVHVPLVIHYPRAVPAGRIHQQVSTAGLFHTLVGLTGTEPPQQPILTTDLLHPGDDPVVSELNVPCGNPERRRLDLSVRDWTASYRAVVHDGLKLIWSSNGAHELYDLVADPREHRDLFGSGARDAEAQALLTALETWRREQPTFEVSDEERAAEAAARLAEQDDDLAEQLEALGYVED